MLAELSEIIDAYELMLADRCRLEELLLVPGQLDSLDDLEQVAQHHRRLHAAGAAAEQQAAQLTADSAALSEQHQRHTQHLEADNAALQARLDQLRLAGEGAAAADAGEAARLSGLLQRQATKIASLEQEATALRRQIQGRAEELHFLREQLDTAKCNASTAKRSSNTSASTTDGPPTASPPSARQSSPRAEQAYIEELEAAIRTIKATNRRHSLSSAPASPAASSADLTGGTVAALRSEIERVSLENIRLKAAVTPDYQRNLILQFLQKPEHRPDLLHVLCKALGLSDKERSTIKL